MNSLDNFYFSGKLVMSLTMDFKLALWITKILHWITECVSVHVCVCVCKGSFNIPSNNSWTPAGCSTIHLNSDMIYSEVASGPTG